VDATDKSIAAGGKDSVKNEFGVSDPYATAGARKAINTKELMQKLQKIQSISLKVPSRAPSPAFFRRMDSQFSRDLNRPPTRNFPVI
jgi:hypothetical protein